MVEVEIAPEPPRKRRQLEAADDKHLAIWATDPSLPPGARRRAQDERDRRKRLRRTTDLTVAVLEENGGATPTQVRGVAYVLAEWHPALVLQPFCSKSLHKVVRDAAPLELIEAEQVVRADRLIGLPTAMGMPEQKTEGLWKHLRHAKDRGVDVMVIWPDGDVLTGRW